MANKFEERDNVIYFSVTPDGTTGEEWIKRLKDKGSSIGDDGEGILRSQEFRVTSGSTTQVAILRGALWNDGFRSVGRIRKEALYRGLITPNAEIACLIREKFTDAEIGEMGLWSILTMHEPIGGFNGIPSLLGATNRGTQRLDAWFNNPMDEWRASFSFAFVVSQV